MVNTNLFQTKEAGEKAASGLLNKNFFIYLVPLVAVLIVYGAGKIWSQSLDGQKTGLESGIERESSDLFNKDTERVADFQHRLDEIGASISTRRNPLDFLRWLEQNIIAGAAVSKLELSGDNLKMEIAADNYMTIAKQILAFKKSESSRDVRISALSRDSKGGVGFSAEISLRK